MRQVARLEHIGEVAHLAEIGVHLSEKPLVDTREPRLLHAPHARPRETAAVRALRRRLS